MVLVLSPEGLIQLQYLAHPKQLDVNGVVQSTTGAPVKNAKVVVTAWDSKNLPWDRGPHKFGTVTDNQGRYSLKADVGFRISSVYISACGPDDAYAFIQIHEKDRFSRPQTIVVREQRLEKHKYRYNDFRGPYSGDIEFVDRAWPTTRGHARGVRVSP